MSEPDLLPQRALPVTSRGAGHPSPTSRQGASRRSDRTRRAQCKPRTPCCDKPPRLLGGLFRPVFDPPSELAPPSSSVKPCSVLEWPKKAPGPASAQGSQAFWADRIRCPGDGQTQSGLRRLAGLRSGRGQQEFTRTAEQLCSLPSGRRHRCGIRSWERYRSGREEVCLPRADPASGAP